MCSTQYDKSRRVKHHLGWLVHSNIQLLLETFNDVVIIARTRLLNMPLSTADTHLYSWVNVDNMG